MVVLKVGKMGSILIIHVPKRKNLGWAAGDLVEVCKVESVPMPVLSTTNENVSTNQCN